MDRRINIIKLIDSEGDIYTFTTDGIILFRYSTLSNILTYTLSEAKEIAKKYMKKGYENYEIIDLEEML